MTQSALRPLRPRLHGRAFALLGITALFGCNSAEENISESQAASRESDPRVVFSQPMRLADELPGRSVFGTTLAIGPHNELCASWVDTRNENFDVFFSRSTDGAASFSRNIELDYIGDQYYYSTRQADPAVAVGRDGTIYAAWSDGRDYFSYQTRFARSTDGGATFSKSIQVGADKRINYPTEVQIALDQNTGIIYVVWADDRNVPGASDIYLARSTDGGETFEPSIRVDDAGSNDIKEQAAPSIAVDNLGYVHVVWQDQRPPRGVRYARSTNRGLSFGASQLITRPSPVTRPDAALYSQDAQVGTDAKNNVYIAWNDDRLDPWGATYFDVWLRKSTDGGVTFGPDVSATSEAPGNVYRSRMAVSAAGYVYMAWGDKRQGTYWDLRFAKSDQGATSFGPSQLIEGTFNGRPEKHNPNLAVDTTGRVYLTWEAGYQPTETFLVRGLPGTRDVSVWYRNGDPGDSQRNWIKPVLQIKNESSESIPLQELTLRYWFTNETAPAGQVAKVDFATSETKQGPIAPSDILLRTASVERAHSADTYLEVGFAAAAGEIAPGRSVVMQLGLHPEDWSLTYDESDDYSFSSITSVQPTDRVTAYRNGLIVSGNEPTRWGKEPTP